MVKSPVREIERNCGRDGWKEVYFKGVSIGREDCFDWVVFIKRVRGGVEEVEIRDVEFEEIVRDFISER